MRWASAQIRGNTPAFAGHVVDMTTHRQDPGMDGPRERFEALYHQYYDEILHFVARRSDPQTARDVTAETFLAAWRRLATVDRSNERPWLYVTARNMLANEFRGRGRRARLDERLLSQPRIDGDDPANRVTDQLHARQLFDTLPPKDREALALTEWEQLDIATAARVAGCSPATFRVRLHRARRRLATAHEHSLAEPVAGSAPIQLAEEALS
jgi:RNA polymerase sigma-70 factor (ECF subfamily)